MFLLASRGCPHAQSQAESLGLGRQERSLNSPGRIDSESAAGCKLELVVNLLFDRLISPNLSVARRGTTQTS